MKGFYVISDDIQTAAFLRPFRPESTDDDVAALSHCRCDVSNVGNAPMPEEEAMDLLLTKLGTLQDDAQKKRIPLEIDPHLVPRIVTLSGGHPHLLQLLGAYPVHHESEVHPICLDGLPETLVN